MLLYKCERRNQIEVNICEILEVNITPFALKASYCSKGTPQKLKYELCSNVDHDR